MVVNWDPLPKAKSGYEREFAELFHKLATATVARRPGLLEWFANVSEPAYAVLGAPRVGYDEAADDWLRKRLAKRAPYAQQEPQRRATEIEAMIADARGTHVLQLLPPCDGFPVYSNYLHNDALERYSFNAQLILEERGLLGDELWQRAQTPQLPDAHSEFAERLHEIAQRFALDNELGGDVETIREPVFAAGSTARRGHVLFAAAKWCTYWSFRGHGLMPL